MNAICLVVDRLHAGHLGAYGNTWIETPAFDRLAAEAFTFDHALIDSPRVEDLCRSYWQGCHALCPPSQDRSSLAAALRNQGVNTALLSDDRSVIGHPLSVDFDEVIEIDPPWQPKGAEQIEQTHLAACFAQAISWLRSAEEPYMLWCHLAGLGTTWDAPGEFRTAYWEQGDPLPPPSADVPELMLGEDHDPDELFGIALSYAGQVSLLDTCLGALTEFLGADPAAGDTLLLVTGARGFPLGEHRRVGPCDEALYGELVHVPLLLRLPGALGAAARSRALVEPADVWATLSEFFGAEAGENSATGGSLMPVVRQEVAALRDRLCVVGRGGHRAIRTPAWYFRTAARPELFAKPDDRWEVNNVVDRCREVAECLGDVLSQYEQTILSGHPSHLPPLSEVLLNGLE